MIETRKSGELRSPIRIVKQPNERSEFAKRFRKTKIPAQWIKFKVDDKWQPIELLPDDHELASLVKPSATHCGFRLLSAFDADDKERQEYFEMATRRAESQGLVGDQIHEAIRAGWGGLITTSRKNLVLGTPGTEVGEVKIDAHPSFADLQEGMVVELFVKGSATSTDNYSWDLDLKLAE